MTTERLGKLPPLENGDRLTRREFEQRYHAMLHLKKAELIEGVVYGSSPVRVMHSQAHADLMGTPINYGQAGAGAPPPTLVLRHICSQIKSYCYREPLLIQNERSQGGTPRFGSP